jgi:hypothetical protein
MAFHEEISELLIVGSSPEIFRFNFEQGIFMKPIESITGIDSINVNF